MKFRKASKELPPFGVYNGLYNGDHVIFQLHDGGFRVIFYDGSILDEPKLSVLKWLDESEPASQDKKIVRIEGEKLTKEGVSSPQGQEWEKEFKRIRNYFGEHDKTAFEHWAFSFLDNWIKTHLQPTEPPRIDWNTLRDKFFKECTDDVPIGPGVDATRKKVNLTPHHVFEWFKTHLQPTLQQVNNEEVSEPITTALYNSGINNTDQCDQLAENILTVLNEYGFEIVKKQPTLQQQPALSDDNKQVNKEL